jgi:anti-sigma regulatory factor (Ser/Thr protein kinase)
MHQLSPPRIRVRQLAVPAHPAAVAWTRRTTAQVLREWGVEELLDTAMLLASELVTNAVRASGAGNEAGPPTGRAKITFALWLRDTSLLMEVWDPSLQPAIRQDGHLTAESGRGLLIVETLASRWGQRAMDDGKVVWCEIGLPAVAAADWRRRPA